jgi:plastocyanin
MVDVRFGVAMLALTGVILAGCSSKSTEPGCTENCPGEQTTTPAESTTSVSTTSANTTTTSTTNSTSPVARNPITWNRNVTDNNFPDGTFTVQRNDTVQWTHRGSFPHSVTSAGNFDSHPNCPPACMVTGQTFSHKFDQVGEFRYVCRVHSSMTGTITVVEVAP